MNFRQTNTTAGKFIKCICGDSIVFERTYKRWLFNMIIHNPILHEWPNIT